MFALISKWQVIWCGPSHWECAWTCGEDPGSVSNLAASVVADGANDQPSSLCCRCHSQIAQCTHRDFTSLLENKTQAKMTLPHTLHIIKGRVWFANLKWKGGWFLLQFSLLVDMRNGHTDQSTKRQPVHREKWHAWDWGLLLTHCKLWYRRGSSEPREATPDTDPSRGSIWDNQSVFEVRNIFQSKWSVVTFAQGGQILISLHSAAATHAFSTSLSYEGN